MTETTQRLPLSEKVGYAMGDAASNLVWRGALAYLAVFYTDVFGISAVAASLLILMVRLSDGVTDIIMGIIADRTNSRWGKFRPWILWSAPVLGAFMVLSFTTPDLSYTGKLIWAYVTYIGLTLAYTVSNVPYSALMGVMTPDHTERSVLSGWRFAGAFFGGALITGFLPSLVALFGDGNQQQGYQYTMYMFAVILVIMFVVTFATTKERVKPIQGNSGTLKSELKDLSINLPFIILPLVSITLFFYYRGLYSGIFFVLVMAITVYVCKRLIRKEASEISEIQRDLVDLITNHAWWLLLGIGFLFMMFNGIKQGTVAYYFKYYAGDELLAGAYFIALLVVSMVAALCVGYLTRLVEKKTLFVWTLILGGAFTCLMGFIDRDQIPLMFVVGCLSEVFAAIMPVLYFSMLGDVADFSEWKTRRRATGLFFSAGTFINKTGGGFAAALILLVLAGYGYDGLDAETAEAALPAMRMLMSWIPAGFAFLGALVMMWYPLNAVKMSQIEADLAERRALAE